jgi:hypothetical protein
VLPGSEAGIRSFDRFVLDGATPGREYLRGRHQHLHLPSSRVPHTYSIRRHDHLDILGRLEPIQLVQQLQHGPLHLGVPSASASAASR